MPVAMFQVLYSIAWEKMQSEEGEKEIQADAVENEIEEGGLMP